MVYSTDDLQLGDRESSEDILHVGGNFDLRHDTIVEVEGQPHDSSKLRDQVNLRLKLEWLRSFPSRLL